MAEVAINEMHRNPYDWRRTCGDDPLGCYPEMAHIDKYLNSSIVKKALGVPQEAPFFGVSFDVFNLWEEIGDLWKSSAVYVNYLLNSGIRVLIYVGDKDLYCNAAGDLDRQWSLMSDMQSPRSPSQNWCVPYVADLIRLTKIYPF
ncbi:Carboxypeptidase Y [Colletotrichum viniferum]|nr:Carboxypeptidase Y [Colletotrichum viniferum]